MVKPNLFCCVDGANFLEELEYCGCEVHHFLLTVLEKVEQQACKLQQVHSTFPSCFVIGLQSLEFQSIELQYNLLDAEPLDHRWLRSCSVAHQGIDDSVWLWVVYADLPTLRFHVIEYL